MEIGTTPPEYNCRTCGLCCHAEYDYGYYVDLTDDDLERLSPYYRRTHVVEETKYFPALATVNRDDGAILCVAFRGKEMVSCKCAIYDRRPQAYQDFKPENEICREIRRLYLQLGVNGGQIQPQNTPPNPEEAPDVPRHEV